MNPLISYKSLSQANQEALNEAIMDMGITSYDDLVQAVEVAETFICEATMLLTFKQFQATRTAKSWDMERCHQMGHDEDSMEVFEYTDGCYIECGDGVYHLIIGPAEWRSNDLESLERLLYDKWYA